MLINMGRVGRVGGLPLKTANGLTVMWTYAGGASVASPATIWSENTSDANNNITVKYNTRVVYITKRIAGVNTYVSASLTAVAGTTYAIKIVLNSDNTMQLFVNGVAASAGLNPTDIYASLNMQSGWTTASATILSANSFSVSANNGYVVKTSSQVSGRVYTVTASASLTAGTYRFNNNSGTAILTANGTATFIATGTCYMSLSNNGATASSITLSCQEIYNNTDTTAIPWATVL